MVEIVKTKVRKIKVYKFRRYDSIFPQLYHNERKRIGEIITANVLIEHIGSSAVVNLPGKGIIDIMIACPKKEMKKIQDKLEKKGYEVGSSSDKGRIFLKREAKINGKFRRFHIHITSLHHDLWKKAICFRDYLRKNPVISKKYGDLKKKAIIKCNNEGEIYRKLKNKFIEIHTKKALKMQRV